MFYLRKWNDIITEVQCFHTDSISSRSHFLHLRIVIVIMFIFVQGNLKTKGPCCERIGRSGFWAGPRVSDLLQDVALQGWDCRHAPRTLVDNGGIDPYSSAYMHRKKLRSFHVFRIVPY